MTNHLAGENSPYLLQHAHNPVDWYPWGEEALERARREDKPIFLSIGYAACHWCHVMAHESFEDAATAEVLSQHFIPIKVDREERPDLDGIYMQATVSMTGSGGWPMSVFLTPDLRPFYAGTYFPPVPRHNLPAFSDLLRSLANAWRDNRDEIQGMAARVVESLRESSSSATTAVPTEEFLNEAEAALISGADRRHGGWGRAPKFPQPMAIEFLLRRAAAGRSPSPEGLGVAVQTLRAMARGGMYDVVGGGFARYSTDDEWLVPHFEKMLYDNAQLALTYLHASLIMHDPALRSVAVETLDFVAREMMLADGGFYSSLDADSEGVEGKYYVWTADEIQSALEDPELFQLFSAAYRITARGNWEGRIVLQRALDDGSLAAQWHLAPDEVRRRLRECHARLRRVRELRARPATDDKVIAAWNGLMLQAFAQAARYLSRKDEDPSYLSVATRNGRFLLKQMRPDGKLHRIYRNGNVGSQVFLDDYAAVALGLLDLYQADFDPTWYRAAHELVDQMLERFTDPAGGFFDTPDGSDALLLRPKDVQDGSTPSGSALACEALLRLAALSGEGRYRDRAEQVLPLGLANAERYPTSFARWLSAADLALARSQELAIVLPGGTDGEGFLQTANAEYRPNLVLAASTHPLDAAAPTVLTDRPPIDGRPTAYLCEGFVCRQPTTNPAELSAQL